MKMFFTQTVSVSILLSTLVSIVSTSSVRIRGICANKTPPFVATRSRSCGTPPFVNTTVFGDNLSTTGFLQATPTSSGLDIFIRLNNLPRNDLVLTAWLIWTPFGVSEPSIFKVANHASPCAPFTARFGTGFSTEPNELSQVDKNSAILRTSLNFNPTFAGEGALTRETFCFQKDVPGIDGTVAAQFPTPDRVFIPSSSSYLRLYDQETGFEKLLNGNPVPVRSPVKSLGVEIVAHVDKTTHGISQGIGGVDHYFIIFFPFEKEIGEPTV